MLIWVAIFVAIAIYPLVVGNSFRVWAGITAVIFLLIAIVKPTLISRFYLLWIKFGEALGNILSKIVLTILFYGIFAPIGLFLKLLRKDLLHKKIDKNATTYFIKRQSQPNSMRFQY